MATKLSVLVPAIKEKSGKVIKAKSKAYSHEELKEMVGKPAKGAKHDFELSNRDACTDTEVCNIQEARVCDHR